MKKFIKKILSFALFLQIVSLGKIAAHPIYETKNIYDGETKSLEYVEFKKPIKSKNIDKGYNVIRLIVEESFQHDYEIMLMWSNENQFLEFRVENSKKESERRIDFFKQKLLSKKDVAGILALVEKMNFNEHNSPDSSISLDGAEWTMEILIDNKYNIIKKDNPIDGFIFDMREMLLDLSEERDRVEDEMYRARLKYLREAKSSSASK